MSTIDEKKVMIGFWVTENQKKEIDNMWKQSPDCYRRADFIRAAINQAANKKIF